jgi:phosphonate transport system substrate-binding protein
MKRALLRPLLLLALLCAGPVSAHAKVSLVLGLYPSEKPRNMVEALRPSLNAIEGQMESQLGEEVEIRIQMLSDYVTALNALVAGEVDFARLGPASYVMGKKEQPGLELLAMENSHGGVTFQGMIVVRDDSDLHTVADLKGRSFAFVSERSTLGRYFPQAYLAEAGISAGDLGDYAYVGHHEAVGLAVWAGRFDAGAMNGRMAATAEGLQEALLSLDDPEILAALGFDGFLPAVDNYYEPTRRVIAEHIEDYSQYTPKDTSSLQ